MVTKTPTLRETASRYVISLPTEARMDAQKEVERFLIWFGSERSIQEITALDLERYQIQLQQSGDNLYKRLQPLKEFVNFCQKEGLIQSNISKFLKVRKTSNSKSKSNGNGKYATKAEETNNHYQLTVEGYEKKKAELQYLIEVERPKVSMEIMEARRDKDIRENAAYDAAKQHQGLLEARIRDLENLLSKATIIDDTNKTMTVKVGSSVILKDLRDNKELRYTIVSPSEVNIKEGKLSCASPVGKALLDCKEGDTIEVAVPAGTVHYQIIKLEN